MLFKKNEAKEKPWLGVIFGQSGCIAADMHIDYALFDANNEGKNHKGGTIKRLYERFNKIKVGGKGFYQRKKTENYSFKITSVDGEGAIVKNDIVDVVFSGIKQCIKIDTESGYSITLTKDHPVFSRGEYIQAERLNIGDYIHVFKGKNKTKKERKKRIGQHKNYYDLYLKYHPNGSKKRIKTSSGYYFYDRVREHRIFWEAHINGLTVDSFIEILESKDAEAISRLTFLNKSQIVHHKNGNGKDNSIENLCVMDKKEHDSHHVNKELIKFKTSEDKIVCISDVGMIETYDIVCAEPYRNFICNGIHVHNCGKTTAAIALGAAIIDTENGSSQYDCMRVPANSMQELYAALKEAHDDDSIKCVCIDTLDAIEPWIIAEVIAEGKKELGDKVKELKDFAFGGGYAKMYDKYCTLCNALEKIAQKKCVLILAHEKVRTIEDPTQGSYERSTLKIYDKAAQWFFSRVDFVLYARHEFMVNDGRAISKKKRAVYSQDGVSFAAKSRLKIPAAFELTELNTHVKVFTQPVIETTRELIKAIKEIKQ
jgi:hypothetical protein